MEHYIEMDSVIDFDCIKIQILQVVMMLVSITLYVKIEGRELVYAMYIPLDIALNACTFCFFWLYYYKDKSNTEDTIRVAMRLERMDDKKVSLHEPLTSNFQSNESSFDSGLNNATKTPFR